MVRNLQGRANAMPCETIHKPIAKRVPNSIGMPFATHTCVRFHYMCHRFASRENVMPIDNWYAICSEENRSQFDTQKKSI